MIKIKEKWKSVRGKLFFTLCVVIVLIIILLVLINSIVLGKIYTYNKVNDVKNIYYQVQEFYKNENKTVQDKEVFENNLKTLSLKNNLEIVIKDNFNSVIITTNSNQFENFKEIDIEKEINNQKVSIVKLDNSKKIVVREVKEEKSNIEYILLLARLDNNYQVCIGTPISAIQESVKIANKVLIIVGAMAIVVSAVIASIISKKFSKPILELNEIAEGMSKLDFSKKYITLETQDEINNLGNSINTMSEKLEDTIKQLKQCNLQLEKDIEEKSKLDEMRKQFISDVSHELKTPIALIQGYAEGLVENINTDKDSRKYYADVILDESNKMDKLVKQLLELMKLESGVLNLNNSKIDIVELINTVIKKHKIIITQNKIKIEFDVNAKIEVIADEFYIEQVISNYITNAIKYSTEKNGERKIKITIQEKNNKVRICIFNTGENIKDEDFDKIWRRFYKVDSSRNRDNGGTGIGLAYVKAVMDNYNNKYGAVNKENGVEFYFECRNLSNESALQSEKNIVNYKT